MKLFNKKLNLVKTEKILHKYLNKKLKMNFKYSYKDNCVIANIDELFLKSLNKNVSCNFSVFETGRCHFHFIIGEITKTAEILNLINKFNYDMRGLLILFVSPEGYLWVTKRIDGIKLCDVKYQTEIVFNSLLDKDSIEILKRLAPLCKN